MKNVKIPMHPRYKRYETGFYRFFSVHIDTHAEIHALHGDAMGRGRLSEAFRIHPGLMGGEK